MWCNKCKKGLKDCLCEDLEERLNAAVDAGFFTYKYCKKCDKHYERCKCDIPEWGLKGMREKSNGGQRGIN